MKRNMCWSNSENKYIYHNIKYINTKTLNINDRLSDFICMQINFRRFSNKTLYKTLIFFFVRTNYCEATLQILYWNLKEWNNFIHLHTNSSIFIGFQENEIKFPQKFSQALNIYGWIHYLIYIWIILMLYKYKPKKDHSKWLFALWIWKYQNKNAFSPFIFWSILSCQ